MYVYVNENNEIKSVDIPVDGLTGYYISEKTSPFKGWSAAKICCYKVEVKEGVVMMMTPYIDSRFLDHFDQVGHDTEANADDIISTMDGLAITYENMEKNTEDITTTMDGLAVTYESMEKNTEDIDICFEGIAELYELLATNEDEVNAAIEDMFK